MVRNLRALGIGVCSALVGSVLVGCGTQSPRRSADAHSLLAAATQRTLSEKTAVVAASDVGGDRPASQSQRAQGNISFVEREARLSLGDGTRYVFTSDDGYSSHPGKDPLTGKKWLRIARREGVPEFDDDLRLSVYLAAGAEPSTNGVADEISGVPMTRYETTVAVKTAVETAPEAQRNLVESVLERQLFGRTGKVDFWIDAEGRVRRIRIRTSAGRKYAHTYADGSSISLSTEFPETYTIDYSKFGVEVGATPPPADQVGLYVKP